MLRYSAESQPPDYRFMSKGYVALYKAFTTLGRSCYCKVVTMVSKKTIAIIATVGLVVAVAAYFKRSEHDEYSFEDYQEDYLNEDE